MEESVISKSWSPPKNRPVVIAMHVSEAESRVTHLSQHARFVRGVHVTVVVINGNRNACAGGRLQIDV